MTGESERRRPLANPNGYTLIYLICDEYLFTSDSIISSAVVVFAVAAADGDAAAVLVETLLGTAFDGILLGTNGTSITSNTVNRIQVLM